MLFQDREDAGRQLGERLRFLQGEKNLIVLGIPRGGVIVAAEVARALAAPLDVFIAHKLGAPFNPELAIGALTCSGELVLDDELIRWLKIKRRDIDQEAEEQRIEIARRLAIYRGNRPPLDVRGRVAVVVDDGIATGLTMQAALVDLRRQGVDGLVLAVPVAPPDAIERLKRACDQAVTLDTPEPFFAVGRFYRAFTQTSDEEVIALLKNQAGGSPDACSGLPPVALSGGAF